MGLTTLSWLVLLASICNGVACLCALFGAFLIIFAIIMCIGSFGGFDSYGTKKDEQYFKNIKAFKKASILSLIFGVLFAITAAITPTEKAIYMVAGIETINKFSQTDAAKELGDSGMMIVKDISTIINKYAKNKEE